MKLLYALFHLKISTQNINNLTSQEFAIKDSDPEFPDTGLRISSKVRVTRIATLNHSLVVRRLGRLGTQYMEMLNSCKFYSQI